MMEGYSEAKTSLWTTRLARQRQRDWWQERGAARRQGCKDSIVFVQALTSHGRPAASLLQWTIWLRKSKMSAEDGAPTAVQSGQLSGRASVATQAGRGAPPEHGAQQPRLGQHLRREGGGAGGGRPGVLSFGAAHVVHLPHQQVVRQVKEPAKAQGPLLSPATSRVTCICAVELWICILIFAPGRKSYNSNGMPGLHRCNGSVSV